MRIAIIGAGNVGGTLGRRWAEAGHAVTFGVRPGSEVKGGAPPGTSAESVQEAAADAEVVVLATPWAGTEEAVRSAGDLVGRVVVDATNPLKRDLSGLDLEPGTSAAEQVAGWAAGAHVVKAFNTIGFGIMADPLFGADQTVLLYCGDDAAAKQVVHTLAADIGFDPVDAGPLARARLLEDFALLWISMAFGGIGPNFAFKFLRR